MTALAAAGLAVERAGRRILEGVSLAAAPGDFIGVLGPNGAGKTTLLRTLAGLERPQSGAVAIGGADIFAMSPRRRARARAYLPQERDVAWSMTVEAVVALGRFAYGSARRLDRAGREAVDRALAAVGLEALRLRSAHALSGGEAARMHLARALAAQAPILIADEPVAALDLRHQLAIMTLLREKAEAGGGVVAALHDLDLARRFATRVLILDRGQAAADAPPEAALTAETILAVFGVARRDDGYALSP
jgi:iron complex transport system ATP-binding protein